MTTIRTQAPDPVLSLEEVKAHLRLDPDDTSEDEWIAAAILTAQAQCQHQTGIAIGPQSWRLDLDGFPPAPVALLPGPVAEITAVQYLGTDGASMALDLATCEVTSAGDFQLAYGQTWPAVRPWPGAVRITFATGDDEVPVVARSWMLLAIGTLYANREATVQGTVGELPRDFRDGLLDSIKDYRNL